MNACSTAGEKVVKTFRGYCSDDHEERLCEAEEDSKDLNRSC